MGNDYLNNALNIVYKINYIQDVNEKIEAIYRLSSYCAFIYYSGYINQKEYVLIMTGIKDDPWDKVYNKEKGIATDELINNNELLCDFYKKYILLYNKNFIPKENTFSSEIDIYKEFREFLKYMNCDKLYDSLLSKKKISFQSILKNSICISDRGDSYILVNDIDPFNRYFEMSHEIAHAYENNVLKDEKIYFDTGYNVEILSILFNRIFMEFIIQKGILDYEEIKKLVNKFERNYYDFLLQALFITEIVKSKKYSMYDYEIYMSSKNVTFNCNLTDHNYAIGDIVSLNLLNEWRKADQLFVKNIPNLIKEIRNMKLEELINKYDNEKIVKSEIKKLIIK